ncbi:hypothetical protein AGMMS49921_05020 [Endomicrobiia bacterium]|nr:hypothetical protein AGMMS49921_05020 [Endomicrobiia bacterium]
MIYNVIKICFLAPDADTSDISKLPLGSHYIRVDLDEAKTNDRIFVRLFRKVGIDVDSISEQHYVGGHTSKGQMTTSVNGL